MRARITTRIHPLRHKMNRINVLSDEERRNLKPKDRESLQARRFMQLLERAGKRGIHLKF